MNNINVSVSDNIVSNINAKVTNNVSTENNFKKLLQTQSGELTPSDNNGINDVKATDKLNVKTGDKNNTNGDEKIDDIIAKLKDSDSAGTLDIISLLASLQQIIKSSLVTNSGDFLEANSESGSNLSSDINASVSSITKDLMSFINMNINKLNSEQKSQFNSILQDKFDVSTKDGKVDMLEEIKNLFSDSLDSSSDLNDGSLKDIINAATLKNETNEGVSKAEVVNAMLSPESAVKTDEIAGNGVLNTSGIDSLSGDASKSAIENAITVDESTDNKTMVDLVTSIKKEISNLVDNISRKVDVNSTESNLNLVKTNSNFTNNFLNNTESMKQQTIVMKNESLATNVDANKTSNDTLANATALNFNDSNKYKDSSNSSDTGSEGGQSSNKADTFLNQLIGNKDKSSDNQYARVTGVINQILNNNSVKNVSGETITPTIRSSNLSEDIVKSLKYMNNNNVSDMTVKITPQELGEVSIKVTSENGIMKATITASNKDAYNILNSNLNDLSSQLNNQNIKISDVSINIYSGDTTYFKDASSNGNNSEQKDKQRSKVNGISGSTEDDGLEDLQNLLYEDASLNAFV